MVDKLVNAITAIDLIRDICGHSAYRVDCPFDSGKVPMCMFLNIELDEISDTLKDKLYEEVQ